ncbi:unnamed protein product [Linum trigynum]|uniref:Dirigent protein n=1 Tax=Linum trigynum TaxID=586398 RepID=A0AAV2DHP9_9ROSI
MASGGARVGCLVMLLVAMLVLGNNVSESNITWESVFLGKTTHLVGTAMSFAFRSVKVHSASKPPKATTAIVCVDDGGY